MKYYTFQRIILAGKLTTSSMYHRSQWLRDFVADLLATKPSKKPKEKCECHLHYHQICDICQGITTIKKVDAPKMEKIKEADGNWYISKEMATNYKDRENLLRTEHNKLVEAVNSLLK